MMDSAPGECIVFIKQEIETWCVLIELLQLELFEAVMVVTLIVSQSIKHAEQNLQRLGSAKTHNIRWGSKLV